MRMVAYPPRDFDVKISGSITSPVTEVSLLRTGALLEQLPLLSEIDSSTGSNLRRQSDEESSRNQTAEFCLPCSVWGMVSLLLLLEGSASMIRPWFADPSADPSLINQTLQERLFFSFLCLFTASLCLAGTVCSHVSHS